MAGRDPCAFVFLLRASPHGGWPRLLVCCKQDLSDIWTLKIGPQLLVSCKLALSDSVEEKASHQKCLVCSQCSCNSLGIFLVIPVSVFSIRTELEFKLNPMWKDKLVVYSELRAP